MPMLRATVAALALTLSACGGGGGGGSARTTIVLTAQQAFDAQVRITGEVENGLDHLTAGDDLGNVPTRLFIAFDLSTVPTGVTLLGATLSVPQVNVIGTPYSALGRLEVQAVDLGVALDASDYSTPPISGTLVPALLADNPTLDLKTADVREQLNVALSQARLRLDLRGAFVNSTNLNNSFDVAHLSSIERGTAATLTITYR